MSCFSFLVFGNRYYNQTIQFYKKNKKPEIKKKAGTAILATTSEIKYLNVLYISKLCPSIMSAPSITTLSGTE